MQRAAAANVKQAGMDVDKQWFDQVVADIQAINRISPPIERTRPQSATSSSEYLARLQTDVNRLKTLVPGVVPPNRPADGGDKL